MEKTVVDVPADFFFSRNEKNANGHPVVTAPRPCFVFAFFVHYFSVFQLVRVYLLFRFIPSVIFGYVTFHSFVLVFFMRFFYCLV